MTFPKTWVDQMLLNWGDRLFHDPLRHVRPPRMSRAELGREVRRMREQLARTLRHTPEVMIKITNKASGAQGMGAVRRHLRYISRNGRVELEDQDGMTVLGREALHDLTDAWHLGGWGIPEESRRREVFNVLLSMPPGTNRQAVRDAARAFAAEEFGDGRRYVFAAHDDEAHPHVHLSVQVRGPDGRRLNPRKQDLQRWREQFAVQLREHGVDANATPRRARGETRRYPKQAIVHMAKRGETPHYWRPELDEPARVALWHAHAGPLEAWQGVAHAMTGSPSADDRGLAEMVTHFVQTMPVQQERPDTARVSRKDGLRRPGSTHDRELRRAERGESQQELFPGDPDVRVER
ncbi:relaxase/mobilization nuclease domain-containing protein [Burkholderia multivorans]|uniref:relaxase/mobilization nuclease domain-containing protein n=1 Tax=Burkholderia multivorans TaxID=87883 RepID=UPI001C2781EE|nr:relaxase/mobilization nuclease domain-containing protein [Burkholderia multivorans]MBU9597631.1 relaxase/mobilization nuclease domain-containing protein [Burkholderia multivorans]MDN8000188.1 relaxase/mobilization nuclease domain-containing protein [Burkholderia multivorans]